jgi:hypothetical protein
MAILIKAVGHTPSSKAAPCMNKNELPQSAAILINSKNQGFEDFVGVGDEAFIELQ